jgi:hypothetical protein
MYTNLYIYRRINEELQLEKEGVGALLDSLSTYTTDTVGLVLAPVTYACLQIFYVENQIAQNYEILTNQLIYYIAFSIIIIPFQFCCDNLLFNSQELIFGWKLYDYVAYQRYRFTVREHRYEHGYNDSWAYMIILICMMMIYTFLYIHIIIHIIITILLYKYLSIVSLHIPSKFYILVNIVF